VEAGAVDARGRFRGTRAVGPVGPRPQGEACLTTGQPASSLGEPDRQRSRLARSPPGRAADLHCPLPCAVTTSMQLLFCVASAAIATSRGGNPALRRDGSHHCRRHHPRAERRRIENEPEEEILFFTFTDGEENQSREYSRAKTFDLIKKREVQGRSFAYLGANQDAYAARKKPRSGVGHSGWRPRRRVPREGPGSRIGPASGGHRTHRPVGPPGRR